MDRRRRGNDISGMRSGKVTALELTGQKQGGNILWRCRCDCGKEFFVPSYKIKKGLIQSCGCLRGEKRRYDLAGRRFGKLVAVRRLDKKRNNNCIWLCRCDCGKEIETTTNALMSGNTRSCGCGRAEAMRRTVEKHGTVAERVRLVDGTCIEKLERKTLQRNNTSGHTGVQARGNKWIAVITFKGKVHYLGSYASLENAVRARKQAEEHLFGSFLEQYYRDFPPKEEPADTTGSE